MGKINPEDYKQNSDILGADDIEDAAILTVSEFNDGDRVDGTGKWAMLKFEETDKKIMWLTDPAIQTLVDKFGNNTDNWIGEKIPVERYNTKNGPRVRVMASEEWDKAFKDAGVKKSVSGAKKK